MERTIRDCFLTVHNQLEAFEAEDEMEELDVDIESTDEEEIRKTIGSLKYSCLE